MRNKFVVGPVVGQLGGNPEVKHDVGARKQTVVSFPLAVNLGTDKDSKKDPVWATVELWGALGDVAEQLYKQGGLVKGKQVMVLGRVSDLHPYKSKEGGEARYDLTISATELDLVSPKENGETETE